MGAIQEAAVRRLLALFFTDDIAANAEIAGECFAADATYQPVVPLAPISHGRTAIVAELTKQSQRYKSCLCHVDAIASTDSAVFTERTDTVTMLADGRQVVVRVNAVFELDQDARITAWREYWDVVSVARQVGLTAESMAVVAEPSAEAASRPRTARQVAEHLKRAYSVGWEHGRQATSALFADVVEVRHQPPLPQDGTKPGQQVAEESAAEFTAYRTMLSEFREETTISAAGDTVVCDVVLAGRRADGSELRAPVQQLLTVRDGAFVASEVIVAEDVLRTLIAVVRAGGKPVDATDG